MNYLVLIGRKLIVGLMILQNLSTLQATSISNYAEMGLALAAIPFDMAAQKHTLEKDTKKATFHHLYVNSINILKNSLYLFNNFKFQRQLGRMNLGSRDVLVHYALIVADLKSLYKNLRVLAPARKQAASDQVPSDDLLNFDFDEEESIEEATPETTFDEAEEIVDDEKLSELARRLRLFILPSLKGLTSFALACSQSGATPYESISRKQARYLAAAAHLFTRLFAEYSVSKSTTRYKKLLTAALILNSAWLAYEATQYVITLPMLNRQPEELQNRNENQELFVPLQRQAGECSVCYDDADLLRLHCGHAVCCQGCLDHQLNANALNTVTCPQHGCNEQINRNEFRDITNNNEQRLAAYDAAMQPVRPTTPEAAAALGAKPCPGRGCGVPIYRNGGCQHMTCNQCRHINFVGFVWEIGIEAMALVVHFSATDHLVLKFRF
jgi:hypothetical protein